MKLYQNFTMINQRDDKHTCAEDETCFCADGLYSCSFCFKNTENIIFKLIPIKGAKVYICENCIELLSEKIKEVI